jgi:NAD(P)-dependent dehydrogenase (short-subunit alcohol dehydrogenase family)
MTTILITGATRGIGKETARSLAAAGHTVYVGARSADDGRAVAEELGARWVQLDVTDDASVAAALATVEQDLGDAALDVLVNNAGIGVFGRTDPAEALHAFDVNAVGPMRVTEAALPLLRRSADPLVLTISSALGSFWATENPEHPASQFSSFVYASSKSAVSMLMLQYAHAEPDVRFVAVEPGYTATELGGQPNPHGRPVEVSGAFVAALATGTGALGRPATGTLVQDSGILPW